MGSETTLGLLLLSFYGSLYAYPLAAIWMAISYTAKGSGRKTHFARRCCGLALISAAVYMSCFFVGVYWEALSLPDMHIGKMYITNFVIGFAPLYSPLACLCLFSALLRKRLTPEYDALDIRRLIRLGVMAGHAAMSLPIGVYLAS